MAYEGEGLEIGDRLRWMGLRFHHIERLSISSELSREYAQLLTTRDKKILESFLDSTSPRHGEYDPKSHHLTKLFRSEPRCMFRSFISYLSRRNGVNV